MKTIINIFAATLMILFATSCEDFLGQDMKSSVDADEFFTDAEEALIAVNGVYGAMATSTNSGIYDANLITSEIGTFAVSTSQSDSRYTDFKNYSMSYDNISVTGLYTEAFKAVQKANYALQGVASMTNVSEELKNRMMGEVRFIRALMYFNLVRHFGAVPVKETMTEDMDNPYYARNSIQEVYQLIIKDLEFCVENLWYKTSSWATPRYAESDRGRATRCAAMGLLAKVYLTAASYAKHSDISTGDWNTTTDINTYAWVDIADYYSRSESMARKLINLSESGQVDVSLNNDFGHIFTEDGENNSESLFEVQYTSEPGMGSRFGSWIGLKGLDGVYTYRVKGSPEIFYSYARAYDLANDVIDYSNTDLRGLWTFPMVEYKDGELVNLTSLENMSYFKYRLGRIETTRDNLGNNFPVLRYADVILGYAEALNELGRQGEALNWLNKVRERARRGIRFGQNLAAPFTFEYTGSSNQPADLPSMDIAELREAIIKERQMELAGEGHGRFDALRMGRLVTEAQNTYNYSNYANKGEIGDSMFKVIALNGGEAPDFQIGDDGLPVKTVAAQNVRPRDQFFPIPKDEIDRNPSSILKQNPGY